jgi:hypothetical protein
MTTVFLSDKPCFACGTKSKYPTGNLSPGGVGARDLDGRPTHILRSSVYHWIQRCPSCGYCAPDIAQGEAADAALARTTAYAEQLANRDYPDTANAFLCFGLMMRARGQYADAAWAAVFAAWICDDNGYRESAHICRGSAIELFVAARGAQQEFADSKDQEQLYLIDLHRRRMEFDIAGKLCDETLEGDHADDMLDLLYLERDLIDRRDSAAHSTSEVDDNG